MYAKKIRPVFKHYSQKQGMLLPPSLEDLIALEHPVRVVDAVIEGLNLDPLLNEYKGGGTSSYHPKMLLKVLAYAYVSNMYSSRKIEEACQINVHFMWLAGMQTPDHNTINRFRSERLKEVLRTVFTQVVKLLAEEGLLSLKEVYTDGTKIESAANRYTFVWGKAIKTKKEQICKQLKELWQYAENVAAEELSTVEQPDFTHVDAEKVKDVIERIDKALKDKPNVSKKVKAKLAHGKKHWPENLDKYAEQEKILEERGSYSKTDPDATFMRMKEDHLGNGQLKPAYNVQVTSSNQYVVEYTVHANPGDTITLIPHLAQFQQDMGSMPEKLVADAGYGSEENYEHLEKEGIAAYVKYSSFNNEQQQSEAREAKRPFTQDKLYYNKEQDCFICPMGQKMINIGTSVKRTATGFKQTITKYRNRSCKGCPLRGICHKSIEDARTIEVNHNLNRHKTKSRELLTSEEGIKRRKKRGVDTEPVFGNIKSNHGFRRFMLRGKQKVEIEVGLLALAQNLRKKAA